MSLGLSLSLCQTLRCTQRQELRQVQTIDQRLEQKLEQQLKLTLTLRQYLDQEDFIKGLINWTEQHNSWKTVNDEGFNFTYANVPYKLAKPLADVCGPGFAHCVYNPFETLFLGKQTAMTKGDWVLFVVEDMLNDADESKIVAMHERGEEISLANHYFASKLEFAFARKKGLAAKHTNFIEANYPSKFADLTQKVLFPILPLELLDELTASGKRNKAELKRAELLIGTYTLTERVLNLIEKHSDKTEEMYKTIISCIGPTQQTLHEYYMKGKLDEETANQIVNIVLRGIVSLFKPEDVKGASMIQLNESMSNFSRCVGEYCIPLLDQKLSVPVSFKSIYQNPIYRNHA